MTVVLPEPETRITSIMATPETLSGSGLPISLVSWLSSGR
jgi:hypothetical protein